MVYNPKNMCNVWVMKRFIFSLALFFLSLCLCGIVLECMLRLFFPKYQYAADVDYTRNALRIMARRPNTRAWNASTPTVDGSIR